QNEDILVGRRHDEEDGNVDDAHPDQSAGAAGCGRHVLRGRAHRVRRDAPAPPEPPLLHAPRILQSFARHNLAGGLRCGSRWQHSARPVALDACEPSCAVCRSMPCLRRVLVYSVMLAIVGLPFVGKCMDVDLWPFSRYSMYAATKTDSDLSLLRV